VREKGTWLFCAAKVPGLLIEILNHKHQTPNKSQKTNFKIIKTIFVYCVFDIFWNLRFVYWYLRQKRSGTFWFYSLLPKRARPLSCRINNFYLNQSDEE